MKTLLSTLALLMLSSCANREHMSEDYGRKTRTFFARQHVHQAPAQGSPSGLDSEEAALIQASYRESLGAPKAAAPSNNTSRVLLLEEADDGKKGSK